MKGRVERFSINLVTLLLLLGIGCSDTSYKFSPKEKQQTERDWLNGNFGDPEKPYVFGSTDGPQSRSDTSANNLVVLNFVPKTGPRFFDQGLWIDVRQSEGSYFRGRDAQPLTDEFLKRFGVFIGKNSCGQPLYRVTERELFSRHVTAVSTPLLPELIPVFVVPNPQTLISCFSPMSGGSCNVQHNFMNMTMKTGIPQKSVCSWPRIEAQLHAEISSGMAPQSVRNQMKKEVE